MEPQASLKSEQSDPNAIPVIFLGLIAVFFAGSMINSDPLFISYYQHTHLVFWQRTLWEYCLLSSKMLLLSAGLCSVGYGLLAAFFHAKVRFGGLLKSMFAALFFLNF